MSIISCTLQKLVVVFKNCMSTSGYGMGVRAYIQNIVCMQKYEERVCPHEESVWCENLIITMLALAVIHNILYSRMLLYILVDDFNNNVYTHVIDYGPPSYNSISTTIEPINNLICILFGKRVTYIYIYRYWTICTYV